MRYDFQEQERVIKDIAAIKGTNSMRLIQSLETEAARIVTKQAGIDIDNVPFRFEFTLSYAGYLKETDGYTICYEIVAIPVTPIYYGMTIVICEDRPFKGNVIIHREVIKRL